MMAYNLGTTPAVKAGIADHVWSVEEIIGLQDEYDSASSASTE
jgi:hypothetical protein